MNKTIYLPIVLILTVLSFGFLQTFDFIIINKGGSVDFGGYCRLDVGSSDMRIYPTDTSKNIFIGSIADGLWNNLRLEANEIKMTSNDKFYLSSDSIQLNADEFIITLPKSLNGNEKIRGSLWFCPITKTLKFKPVKKITCGGFNAR